MTYPHAALITGKCLDQLKHNKGNIIVDSALEIRHANLWMRICVAHCCICCCFECEVVQSKCTLYDCCPFCRQYTVLVVVQKKCRLLQRVLQDSPRNFAFMNSTSTSGNCIFHQWRWNSGTQNPLEIRISNGFPKQVKFHPELTSNSTFPPDTLIGSQQCGMTLSFHVLK